MVLIHSFSLRHKKVIHLSGFLVIAIILTWIGETGIAKFSLAGFVIRVIHLGGELIADRFVGRGFFHEGE